LQARSPGHRGQGINPGLRFYLGVGGRAGHGELPRKFLPPTGAASRREAGGETRGNATETRPLHRG